MAKEVSDVLIQQLEVREKARQRSRQLGAAADKQRDQIAGLDAQAAAKRAAAQKAADRARAFRATGNESEAAEARQEADILTSEARQIAIESAAAGEKLGELQDQAAELKRDIAALDAARDEIHQTATMGDILAPWQVHKTAIEDAVFAALVAHWPGLEAESLRLEPVLRDRRRVDKSTHTKGRDGGYEIRAIVTDAATAAARRYLDEHDLPKKPGSQYATLAPGVGPAN